MTLILTLGAGRLIPAPLPRVYEAFWRLLGVSPQEFASGQARLSLRPLGLPFALPVRRCEVRPLALAAWEGGLAGLRGRHQFEFKRAPGGSWVQATETLTGWPLLLIRPFISPGRLSRASQDWLAGLAKSQ